jgi:CDP-diacylglycerol--glycerol-3-phosphate 3-phosphatidyltransferase
MIALVVEGSFWWAPVAIIAVREVAVSVYRVHFGRRGIAVPAKPLAKAKTFVQAFAVGAALLPPVASGGLAYSANVLLWASVALTVVSGIQYAVDGSRAGTTMQ